MDLNKLSANLSDEGAELELRHPETGDIIPGMTITMLGTDSEVFAKRERQKTSANIARAQKRGRNALDPDQLATQTLRDATEDLVVLTKNWRGFELDGERLECTPENVRRIYSDRKWGWIRDQAQAFVNDRGNFFTRAATT